jgi:hypothetical protein
MHELFKNGNEYSFQCPWCNGCIIVSESDVRCKIFRHATYKKNGEYVNPHAPKNECDRLYNDGLINGCGKPFKLNIDVGVVEKCGYI